MIRGIVGRVQLHEALDLEPGPAEDVNPLAMAHVELQTVLVLPGDGVDPSLRPLEALGRSVMRASRMPGS